jgi:hypothetical protein
VVSFPKVKRSALLLLTACGGAAPSTLDPQSVEVALPSQDAAPDAAPEPMPSAQPSPSVVVVDAAPNPPVDAGMVAKDSAPVEAAPVAVVTSVTCGNFTVLCSQVDANAGEWSVTWTGLDGHTQWCTATTIPSEPCTTGTSCQFLGPSLSQYATCH